MAQRIGSDAGERSAPGWLDRARTLMIRRGRLLLAIGSGPGCGLPPRRSCGADDALRMARGRRSRRSGWGTGEAVVGWSWTLAIVRGRGFCCSGLPASCALGFFFLIHVLWVLSQPCHVTSTIVINRSALFRVVLLLFSKKKKGIK